MFLKTMTRKNNKHRKIAFLARSKLNSIKEISKAQKIQILAMMILQ